VERCEQETEEDFDTPDDEIYISSSLYLSKQAELVWAFIDITLKNEGMSQTEICKEALKRTWHEVSSKTVLRYYRRFLKNGKFELDKRGKYKK